MRILLINNYHYQKGGADAVYFNTGKLLEKYGHEVYYFSTNHPSNLYSKETKYFSMNHDYRNSTVKNKIKGFPSFVYNRDAKNKISIILDDVKPDIAHIHLFMGGLSSSILLALKERKIPIIQTVHDYRLICPAYLFTDGKNKICEKCKDKFYLHCMINKCSENNLMQSTILTVDAYFRKYIIRPKNLIHSFIFVSQFSKDKHIEFEPNFKSKAYKLFNFQPNLNDTIPSFLRGKLFFILWPDFTGKRCQYIN